jgi:hypothetical protein
MRIERNMKKVPMRPFSINQKSQKSRWQQRKQRGQSLTVAVIVLFLLLFLAGLFIVLVINNLRDSRSSAQRSKSSKYSQAGVNYLDEQLLKSAEGADWRPRPTCDYVNVPVDPADPAHNVDTCGLSQNDPDYEWIQPTIITKGPDNIRRPKVDAKGNVIGGYTRVSFDGGRALVRVSYRPHYDTTMPTEAKKLEPTSKYIKLEAIGRVGEIEQADPTTYGRSESKGLRHELYAFKQIGLTDYLWQVTNKDGKLSSASLGVTRKALSAPVNPDGTRPQPVPADSDPTNGGKIITDAVTPKAYDIESVFYGPIRVNAGLDFYGKSRFFLNSRRNDTIEIAGAISVQNGGAKVADSATGASGDIIGSAGAFNTFNGLVRDNPRGTDTSGLFSETVNGIPNANANLRAVAATTTPVIDNIVGSGDLTRYRLLTRNAGPLLNPTTNLPYSNQNDLAGRYGWGTGLYIPNNDDVQQASRTLGAAYSLRADWLNPDAARSVGRPYWVTPTRYVPPAVQIELFPRYMKITQTKASSYLYAPNGAPISDPISDTSIVRYTPVAGVGVPTTGITASAEGYPATRVGATNLYEGDYTVFAEGNVRIKGTLGGLDAETGAYFLRHLTVVSGGTIYIDGNLLRDNIAPRDRYRETPAQADPRDVRGKSSIALLAKDYVCVNTTQFLAPDGGDSGKEDTDAGSTNTNTAYYLSPSADRKKREMTFQFSATPLESFVANGSRIEEFLAPSYWGSSFAPQFLMMRHSSAGSPTVPADQGPAPINFLLNGTDLQGGPLNNPTTIRVANPRGTVDPVTSLPGRSQSGEYQNDVYNISAFLTAPLISPTMFLDQGLNNQLTISYDLDADNNFGPYKNYRNSRVGIVPLDIRIEALMYAQEGSFFVIPGPWFNPDPNDTYERFIVNGNRRAGDSDVPSTPRIDPRYPFYGEPMDIRLTVFGGITQNVSAEIGDQTEWMTKWGWVPSHYGSTGFKNGALPSLAPPVAPLVTVHGRNGLFPGPLNTLAVPSFAGTATSAGSGMLYLFDDRMIAPYGTTGPLRPSPYNPTEPLPIAPNLPVAPGLLYKGENPVR